MNDIELIKKTFKEVGIDFIYEEKGEYFGEKESPVIVVEEGYSGFYFFMRFDEKGKLKEYGSYE